MIDHIDPKILADPTAFVNSILEKDYMRILSITSYDCNFL
jgi:hypothetical protein